MNHKYTSDGKKVAIVGALNAKETIVQEIFVTDGTEFPAGEHFVVKTLLDAPSETYKAKEERRIEESIQKLTDTQKRLKSEISQFNFAAKAATEKIKWLQGIKEPEVRRVIKHIKAVICGEYTHVVFFGYSGPEIREWDAELFSRSEGYGEDRHFDGIRLVSLYGVWNGRLELDWRVHSYSDGSGSGNQKFVPCKSFQEAVDVCAQHINAKEHLGDGDVEFCLKYNIPVDEVKNAARLESKAAYIKKQIADTEGRLAKLEADLKAISAAGGTP